MQCSNPRTVTVKSAPGYTGRGEPSKREISVPCGHCVGCRIARSREWVVRCLHEQTTSPVSSFVTLTYKEELCPVTLIPRHLQLFFMRLRKALPGVKIRYLACGEYGEKTLRPHYHIILFGYAPSIHLPTGDKLPISPNEDPFIEKIWGKGLVHVGAVTADSIRYTADYVLKSQHVPRVERDKSNWQYPFMRVSRGLGLGWLLSHPQQVRSITLNGVQQGIPRYYARKMGLDMAEETLEFRQKRDSQYSDQARRTGRKVFEIEDIASEQRGLNQAAKLKLTGEKKL